MFIKNHINYTVIDEYNLNYFVCEEMWIKINMNHLTKVFSVLYRHPKSNLVQFSESLGNSLIILNKQKLTYDYTIILYFWGHKHRPTSK